MFPTDGKRLLASTASEAAIGRRHVVQLGPRWYTRSRHIDQRWSGHPSRRAGSTPPSPVVRAWLGGSFRGVHNAEFGVGDSYRVVSSEGDDSTAWGHLAGSGMLWCPAIAARPHRGSEPIRAPDLGDDTELRGGLRHAPRGL